MASDERPVAEFFADCPSGLAVARAVLALARSLGEVEVAVTKSQVALRRHRGFAYLWRPGRYVRSDVPAVLSIPLGREVDSHRFKEVAHPAEHVWMHHLEIRRPDEVDDEVRGWLAEAWERAG